MAIDIGDAVLSVVVQTAEANAQLANFGATVSGQMAPAAAAVTQTTKAVDDMSGSFAVGYNGAKQLGEVTNLAGETSRESMYQARGEAGLLGEMFGVHLPRHVRSFIAELPGVGTALSAAFQATAVLFIIEAIVQGIEKLQVWREEAHKIELAQLGFETAVVKSFDTLDDKLLRAEIKSDELRQDHLGALRKELELIDHQSLNELEQQFEKLAKAADALFKELETKWYTFTAGSKGAESALTDFKAQYDLMIAEGNKEGGSKLLAGTLGEAERILELQKEGSQNLIRANSEESAYQRSLAARMELAKENVGYDEKALKAQEALVTVLAAQVSSEKEIAQINKQEKDNQQTEAAQKAQADAEKIFKAQVEAKKRADEEEDKLEDDRRNKFISSMQEEEKEKIAATKQGSAERIRIIDAAIKEEEAHGFQDTAYYKSLQTQRIQAVQARIDQEQKAQLKADSESLKNADQEAKRELDAVTQSSHAQEKAIDDLEKGKLLSQREGSKRLIAAYEDEKNKSLVILKALLTEEQALMEKASKQLAAAKLDPAITPEQISQAEQLLNQLKNAVANTETQISKVKTDAQNRELARDRSFYAQSLTLAVAAGNKELTEKLKTNHASLLAAQAELAEAKARGQNVNAIEQEIKSLKKIEAELDKEARSAQNLGQIMQQMQQTGSTAMQGMAESFGTAMEAMVSHQASFGAAMEAATFRLIGQLAQKWGTYFAAKAIADIWWNPGLGSAEFAAAAALFAVGGAMSGLASNIGNKGNSAASAGGGAAGPAKGSPALSAGSAPTQTINVTHLAAGGLVTKPTFAVVGEAGPEAVMPLRDRAAMQALAGAIGAQMRASGGGGGTITIQLKTDTHQFVKELNHNVKTGRVRLEATNTRKVTRQS